MKKGKSHSIRECAVRVCLLGMPEATPIKSHRQELSKGKNSGHVKEDGAGKEPTRLQLHTKSYRQLR